MFPMLRPPARRPRPSRLAPALALLMAAAGCEGPPSVPLFPASGTITVDGKPAEGVELRFYGVDSVEDLDAPRPFARSDPGGRFTLGTFAPGDGAPAGTYKVTLSLIDPAEAGSSNPRDLLGGVYANPTSTRLEATIKEGENELAPFEVQTHARPPARRRPASPSTNGID